MMFKRSALLFIAAATTLLADEDPNMLEAQNLIAKKDSPPSPEYMSQCRNPHRIQVGGNYTYAWISPKDNPTTSGSMGGAQLLYEYCPPDDIYAGLGFNWRIGKTTHDTAPSRSLQDFNLQERLGYTIYVQNHEARFSLFSGLGARYMPEEVSSGTVSVDFDYTTFYVPVGCVFEKCFSSLFSWGFNLQWMPQIFPTVRIEPLGGTHWSLTYELVNFFVESPFKFTWHDFTFSIAPFFEIWHDGRSTATTTNGFEGPTGLVLGLPSNQYLFTGVNVNFGASF